METLTIFTPTYNRAYCLHQCYESLCRQTCKDFLWLIVDDGSTDGTEELVKKWQEDGVVRISYHYQSNQGMHGAHNTAYRLIQTELNTCIDSDDYMLDDAVEKIIRCWREKGSNEVAGLIGLDTKFDGELIGKPLPKDKERITVARYYSEGGAGDKKLVYRTEVVRHYPPYPIFPGEKYLSLGWLYEQIDQDYELLILNEPLVRVEYQPDGSTMNMIRQYVRNPKGFAFIRKSSMVLAPTAKRRFIEAVHYVSSSLIAHNRNFIHESPKKLLTVSAIPLGLALFGYIQIKFRLTQPNPK